MDLLTLLVKIGADTSEYDAAVKKAEGDASSFGSKATSFIGGGLKAAAAVGVAAIGAATTAVGALTKSAVDGYAEYEQLWGGVQKLYGNMGMSLEQYAQASGKSVDEVRDSWQSLEDAQNLVLQNANNAYATAGMSANKYMETATSFSAALINSLGGDTIKAAEQTDVAMRAISDNFNTFGGDITNVQNAFQGFAKQNYTMLDNLKLGYGGTKTEMERLIADANEYAAANGQAADLTIDSFSDIVTAIDLIQQKQNIAGTTAREAGATVAGSIGSVSAAWENLVAGFANPDADLGQLIDNVIVSAEGAFTNMIPVAQRALEGIGRAVTDALPQLLGKIPTAINEMAVPLLEGGVTLVKTLADGMLSAGPQILTTVTGLVSGLADKVRENMGDFITVGSEGIGDLVDGLLDGAGALLSAGGELVQAVAEGFIDGLPALIQGGMDGLTELVSGFTNGVGQFVDAGLALISSLADGLIEGLPAVLDGGATILSDLLSAVIENAPKLIAGGIEVVSKLAVGLIEAIPTLIPRIQQIVDSMFTAFTSVDWLGLGKTVLIAIGNGITALLALIPNLLKQIGENAWNNFKNIDWQAVGKNVVTFILNGIKLLMVDIPNTLRKMGQDGANAIKNFDWIGAGRNIVNGLINGVKALAGQFKNVIINLGKGALDGIKEFFGIHSPSTVFRDDVGRQLVLGLAEGVRKNEKYAKASMEEVGSAILDVAQKTLDNYKVYQQISLADEAEYWSQVRDQTQEGTQARIDADKKLIEAEELWDKQREKLYTTSLDLTKNFNEKYAKAYQDSIDKISAAQDKFAKGVEKVDSKLKENLKKLGEDLSNETKKIYEDLQKDIDKINEDYAKSVSSRAGSIMGSFGLFDEVKIDQVIDKSNLLNNLRDQVNHMAVWDAQLDNLARKIGQDNPLMEELQGMGVSSWTQLQQLNMMSEEELDEYVRLYNRKREIAEERAKQENATRRKEADAEIEELKSIAGVQAIAAQENARTLRAEYMSEAEADREQLRTEMEQTIEEIRKAADKQMTELKDEYVAALDDLAWTCRDEGNDVGKLMMRGMQEGIEENLQDVVDAAVEAARAAYQAAVAELDIHSPSKKFIWIGQMVDKGFAKGISDGAEEVSSEMRNILALGDFANSSRTGVSKMRSSNYNREYNQTINITSPQPLSPSEVARQTRIANQQMVLALNGV